MYVCIYIYIYIHIIHHIAFRPTPARVAASLRLGLALGAGRERREPRFFVVCPLSLSLSLSLSPRVSAEVTFGRGDLGVYPWGLYGGPMNVLFLIGGISPRGPHRDKH